MYRIALRMLGDREDAEDVTQDVAVQLLTALAGFSGGSSFTTWLYRIVINRCLNYQRRSRDTRPLLESDHPPSPGPEQTVEARGRIEATGAALAGLPASLRSALVLHEMEGLSYQEVATILKVSEPTVRGRIYRARRTLLHALRDWS
jgi:RNA polymerase sigma-70 factor (ECF subfamily)